MLLSEYRPRSMLATKATRVLKPRFPVVDVHNHLNTEAGRWGKSPVSELLAVLDQVNVRIYVDLDGGWGEDILRVHLDHFRAAAPERFCVFGGVNWGAWQEQGDHFGEWAADRLRVQAALGAEGLKVWKELGLSVRDQRGALVAVDDERLTPLWEVAAELGFPVLIHVGDPVAFFDPLDATNERWEELHAHPDWHFPGPLYPAFATIVNSLANLVARHPRTTFIGAHVGCYAENLQWVSDLLDRCSNFYVDIAARISELGRQPYAARRFLIKHADRVLFGTDFGPDVNMYRTFYRFLETDDEYFNYDVQEIPRQGRWHICGVFLPDDVLEKIYCRNAERIFLRR